MGFRWVRPMRSGVSPISRDRPLDIRGANGSVGIMEETTATSEDVGFRRLAAVVMFLAVALGAVAAHMLKDRLGAADRIGTWDTAVLYHLIHGVALFVVAGMGRKGRGPSWCFLIGIVLFSGSLYLLSLTEMKWLVALTPFGGISFLVGWAWLAIRG